MRKFIAPFMISPLLALLLLAGTPAAAQLPEPEVWFNPHGPGVDMYSMWTPTAPWQQAASKVNVLVLVHWVVRQATDDQLISMRDFAALHHMKIDLSTEPIAKFPTPVCGNEEGYMLISEMAATVARLISLGIKVDWVDMDGPLQAGSYDNYPGGCHLAIPDLVTQVALTMNLVVAAWPGVRIMEIEPLVAVTSVPTWRADETAFHLGLAHALGRRVEVMQSDVEWVNPRWKQSMLALHEYTRQQNLGYSVIYDASSAATSDATWISGAVSNFEAVEGELHIIPDKILFTSWSPYPLYNMPETSPTAQTWLINRYVRPRPILQAQFVGRGVHGKLFTPDGKPVAGVTINGYKHGVDFTQPLPVQVVTGVVPATSVQAIIGVRVNVECNCTGTNDLLLGNLSYQESQGGTSRYTTSFPTTASVQNGVILGGEYVGGTLVNRIIALSPNWTLWNSNVFPVTANAQYQWTIPAATVGGVGWAGNVILIFIDASGNGTRITVVPAPGKALVSTTVTAADGTFALPKLPRAVDGPNPVSVEFDGAGGNYRPNIWTPLH